MARMTVALLLAVSCLWGCLGRGDGWVTGTLWLESCDDGESLGESYSSPADFDLHVDFFAGELMEDSNKSVVERRNGLVIRLQNTSNNVEVADGLLIQIVDLDVAAAAFARGEPLAVSTSDLCPGGNCALTEDSVRASLYLYASCPDGRQPLTGAAYTLTPAPNDGSCMVSTGVQESPCPTLSADARQKLDQLCEGDFNDRTAYDAIGEALGSGACIYLCRLGDARRGQDAEELAGFRVEYGDRVSALLSMRIVDGRAINLQGCAAAAGELRGMFDFELARGRSAQSFP